MAQVEKKSETWTSSLPGAVVTESGELISLKKRRSHLMYERFHRRLDEIEAELAQLEFRLGYTPDEIGNALN